MARIYNPDWRGCGKVGGQTISEIADLISKEFGCYVYKTTESTKNPLLTIL